LRLKKYGFFETLSEAPGIRMRGRMPYTDFLALISRARAVFSDGGSNQEELSYLGVPTILYRDRSERPDGLGGNIVLRSNIDSSLRRYIESGELDGLRGPSRIESAAQPSYDTVEALLKWSAGNRRVEDQDQPKLAGN
jgi:UDP-N-acetylglucosamine 2-epimerase (non-hydrolysing)